MVDLKVGVFCFGMATKFMSMPPQTVRLWPCSIQREEIMERILLVSVVFKAMVTPSNRSWLLFLWVCLLVCAWMWKCRTDKSWLMW